MRSQDMNIGMVCAFSLAVSRLLGLKKPAKMLLYIAGLQHCPQSIVWGASS